MTQVETSSPAPRYARQAARHDARRALQIAGIVAVGLGALLAFSRLGRTPDIRPLDSAPSRARRHGFGEGTAVSAAITVNETPELVRRALEDAVTHGLAGGMLGAPDRVLHRVAHDTPDVLSWRSPDGRTLVKLILRPARGGRMTAVTGLVAVEDAGPVTRLASMVGSGPKAALQRALTEFRMRLETGETARAN